MFLHLILGREHSLKYGTYLEVFVKLEFECNELLNTHITLPRSLSKKQTTTQIRPPRNRIEVQVLVKQIVV